MSKSGSYRQTSIYVKMSQRVKLSTLDLDILNAARKKKIKVTILGRVVGFNLMKLEKGKKIELVRGTTTSKTSFISMKVAQDKFFTNKLLKSNGLPVPLNFLISSQSRLLDVLEKLSWPVVVKPNFSRKGKGVSCNIKTKREALLAFKIAQRISKKVLVEEQIIGRDLRLLIINKKLIAVLERIPPYVIGDSRKTIKQLVAQENNRPLRKKGRLKNIIIDEEVRRILKQQDLTPRSVLKKGKKIFLRRNANISTGGVGRDLTKKVHPDIIRLAIRATETVGLDIAGVDMLVKDISKSPDINGIKILEVNGGPNIVICPVEGEIRKIGEAIINMLFGKN